MSRTASELRADAEKIWWAGVAAVAPERLVRSHVTVERETLVIDEEVVDLNDVERIAIVGAGKAAAGMAVSLEDALGPRLLAAKHVTGWINVPADCVIPSQRVQIHAGRPAGVNEPRPEGVAGTRRILEIVSTLGPRDLCICLLTGGGSALLPAPVPEISLAGKVRVTQLLSAAGANIEQLNTVRRHLSLIKGGGLARACGAGRLITLLISDVLGDPLEMIGSGPTVAGTTTPSDALDVLEALGLSRESTIERVRSFLEDQVLARSRSWGLDPRQYADSQSCRITHHVLGNNATAVDAAGAEAERLGYAHAMISVSRSEGSAEEVGRHLAEMAIRMRSSHGPNCLISGGEPTVTLVDESQRGKGGRNQQLALASLEKLGECEGISLLSAGTDGEDGPTDAAGAVVTQDVVQTARAKNLDAREYLARNDAYRFFAQTSGLFITGPTHTNVCDLRVVVLDQSTLCAGLPTPHRHRP
jgi:hydroxypyruvate reductase